MKQKFYYLSAILMVFSCLSVNSGATSNHKKSSSKKPLPTDHRLRDYQQKYSDLGKRIESAGKAISQAGVDYKAQVERKEKEHQAQLKSLAERYSQNRAAARKTIAGYRQQQDELGNVIRKRRDELKAQEYAAAKAAREAAAKKKAAAYKAARDAAAKKKAQEDAAAKVVREAAAKKKAVAYKAVRDAAAKKKAAVYKAARDAAAKKKTETRKPSNDTAARKKAAAAKAARDAAVKKKAAAAKAARDAAAKKKAGTGGQKETPSFLRK